MLLELSQSHFGSLSQNIPEVKLKNLYRVENPLSLTGSSYVTRPVLSSFTEVTGDIRGIYHQQGFNNDNLLVVADSLMYSVNDEGVSTNVGSISGEGVCKFASTIFGVCIVSGNFLYLYDGAVVTEVDIPDDLLPADVASLNNYFIIAIKNSNKYYWINPGDTVIDPLSFASAEANPDYIVSVKTTSDELWLIGSNTSEVWAGSGDADAPFVRISGRIFNTGCISETSAVSGVNNSLPALFWVSDTLEVILAQGSPSKISNDYVEEVLRNSTRYYSWFFRKQRNDFYIISTDVATLVFDVNNNSWGIWSSLGQNTWKVSKGVQKGTALYGIDTLNSGTIYRIAEGLKDGETDWLVCEVTGFVPHNTINPLPCRSVKLVSNPGFSSGYETEPAVEMRWSDDQGANWSDYMQASLGGRGVTNQSIEFRSLGLITIPGRRFEFRFSLSEPFRIDYAILNNEA